MAKLIHFRERCIGCNACVEIDYEHWRMSRKDGKAVLVKGIEKRGIYQLTVAEHEFELCERVVEACPVNVIRLER